MSVFIAAACRTPVAPRDGALADLLPHELAAPVIGALLTQADVAGHEVDELIVSCALGPGGNPARSVALAAGLPQRIAGLSMDRQCVGGMDALLLARQMILSGAAEVVIAGGVESYSRQPLRAHTFADGRPAQPYAQAPFTPWPDRDPDMAEAADALAKTQGISRNQQDDWAVRSHARARAQTPREAELVALAKASTDTFTRKLSMQTCARSPVITGSITAANAAVAADGAAFCLLVSERVARRLKSPLSRVCGGCTLGDDPTCPGLAPVPAIQHTLRNAGLCAADLTLSEVMEAYAVQAIACIQATGLDPARVNRGGGALARGHPIGASGAINVVRLHHDLIAQGSGTGLASIAAAGGLGTALLLEV